MVPIYVISLDRAPERWTRMEHRLKFHGLDYQRVQAIDINSNYIDYLLEGLNGYGDYKLRGEAGCFASHLKALRMGLEQSNGENGFIVMEDDVMLINNFKSKFEDLFDNVPEKTSLVSLGYFIDKWVLNGKVLFPWGGKEPKKENLCRIHPDHTWGTQAYWISLEYAKLALNRYDKPFRFLRGYRTSELITRSSGGIFSYPPLVIEEGLDSFIRNDEELKLHLPVFQRWGYHNYSDGDPGQTSPLVNKSSTFSSGTSIK